MGVNSVPSTVSPCSTHCLPSSQWTKVCVCVCLYVCVLHACISNTSIVQVFVIFVCGMYVASWVADGTELWLFNDSHPTPHVEWDYHFPVVPTQLHPPPPTPDTHFTLVFTPFTPPTHVHPLSALQVSRPTDGDHLSLLTHSSWHRTTCDCKHT